MNRNESFNSIAEQYDEYRLSFDDGVFDWLVDRLGLTTASKLLEIAPGTGQATMSFARRGFSVRCVELGSNLARILREKVHRHPNVQVDVGAFETWVPPEGVEYDLIYCATAFHWIPKPEKFEKTASLLAKDGHLAVLYHEWPDPGLQPEYLQRAYALLKSYKGEEGQRDSTREEREVDRAEELVESGYFDPPELAEFPFAVEETREQFIGAFKTQSSYTTLDAERKIHFDAELADIAETIPKNVTTNGVVAVHLARRRRVRHERSP